MKYLGSEIPAFSDELDSSNPLPRNCLAFSHGRAALSWYIRFYNFRSVLLCAYTCPSLIEIFNRMGIQIAQFDIGEDETIVSQRYNNLPSPLAIIPALFGGKPIVNQHLFKAHLIDAAQTAFGYLDYPRSTVLSCPRKTTSLSDGAILRFYDGRSNWINHLPLATRAIAFKTTARMLWRSGDDDRAVIYNAVAETEWPLEPCRMSQESLYILERMNVQWHIEKRRKNYNTLSRLLGIPHHQVDGTPFCYPFLVPNRDKVLKRLHSKRLYANKLWWNATIDKTLYPNAARYADELICLPVDQRYSDSQMRRVAKIVLSALS